MAAARKKDIISQDEMEKVLRSFIQNQANGSLSKAADLLCTSPGHLSEILKGIRSFGEDVAARLGFQKVKQKQTVTVIFYLKH